jgi:hypothetical protein
VFSKKKKKKEEEEKKNKNKGAVTWVGESLNET